MGGLSAYQRAICLLFCQLFYKIYYLRLIYLRNVSEANSLVTFTVIKSPSGILWYYSKSMQCPPADGCELNKIIKQKGKVN